MYKFSLRCLKGFVVITFEQSKQSLGNLKGFVVYYNVLRTLRVSPMFGGGVAFAAQHEVQKFLTSTLHIRRFRALFVYVHFVKKWVFGREVVVAPWCPRGLALHL
jgi:hypothetical protein